VGEGAGRGAQRIGVHRLACADAWKREPRGLQLAFNVHERRRLELAGDLALLGETCEQSTEGAVQRRKRPGQPLLSD